VSERATLEATLRKTLTPKFFWIFIAYAFALASTRAGEPFQAAAPAADQQSTACGAKAYCYDTPHFAATVTSFRTSTVNGYKIIDTSIRFVNKTDQPLVLGYVTASGFATDDRGNRSAVGGPNGYRGIGLVVGNNFDPKMIVRPGGWGEAQFELVLQGAPEIVGFHYVLDLTVAEVKTLEGNQHMLDGEFPLHFEGLANGVSQGAGSFAGAPDGLANAVSNLKAIFGKKKAVQNAATVANSAASTAAAVNAAANSAASQSSAAAVANTLGQAGPSSTAASQASTSTPNGVPASAPAGASQSLPANGGNQQPVVAGQSAAAPRSQGRASASPAQADLRGAALADPSDPDPNLGTAKVAVSAGKYDVVGIKLGMPAKDALSTLKTHGQFQITPDTLKYDFLPSPLTYGVSAVNAVVVRNGEHALPESEKIYLVLTMPPSQQVVTKISRYLMFSKDTAPTAESLVASLIKKYGTPSYDSKPKDLYASGSRYLYWVDDAQGHRLLNQEGAGGGFSDQINNCRSLSTFSYAARNIADPSIQVDSVQIQQVLQKGYTALYPTQFECANLTMIHANIFYGYPIGVAAHDVAGGLVVVMGSAPLDHTAADATREYLVQAAKSRDLAQKQKAQKNKPVL
jgi:hypothetical protein